MDKFFTVLFCAACIGIPFCGWINHIVTCFQQELWGFLIAGAIFFPIGIFHGIWLWF